MSKLWLNTKPTLQRTRNSPKGELKLLQLEQEKLWGRWENSLKSVAKRFKKRKTSFKLFTLQKNRSFMTCFFCPYTFYCNYWRSEERRVGKECRFRLSSYCYKKKVKSVTVCD